MFRYLVVLLAVLCVACEGKKPPAPSPGPGPGGGESITGRERIGWDQPSSSAAEVATFRFAIYVDGVRSVLANTTCGTSAGANGFACSGQLPTMSAGTHTLELATFTDSGLESPRSPSLTVTVSGATSPAAAPLKHGEHLTTSDGVRLELQMVAEGLVDPADIALAPDGRAFIAQRAGNIRIIGGENNLTALTLTDAAPDQALLALALDPAFSTTRHVFLTYVTADGGTPAFRTARYREVDGRLVDRMVLLPDLPTGAHVASAALRFGADGKLYAAFDDGGSADAAGRLSDWRGKILRLEADGRTPGDQPAASPVLVGDLASPRSMAPTADGSALWLAERGRDGIDRLRAVLMSRARPRRAEFKSSYVLPPGVGAASMAVHSGNGVPEFTQDLFVAAQDGGYLLRVRFDREDPMRVETSERLFEGRAAAVRAVALHTDGSIYFCTADALWRLVRVP